MKLAAPLVALSQWIALGALVGVLAGSASALFLVLLEAATLYRIAHTYLVFALPVAGLAIGWLYERFGQPIRSGNDLVIDTIHDEGPEIPARMAPMVLIGTVLTHLFGGSAGREGTAVQMGASLADGLSHRLKLPPALRQQLLSAGVAGGFGSVFGTPIAGTLFGLEFLVVGQIQFRGLIPALTAAVIGDMTTRAWGVGHTPYPAVPDTPLTLVLLLKWLLVAGAVAATTTLFIELVHAIKKTSEKRLKRLPLRMFAGGLTVVAMWQLIGTDVYLGLGVPTIVQAFLDPGLPAYAFAAKLVFTAVTLGAGFLGGEVTPLFFIGATLGNAMGRVLDLPLALSAGVGLAAAFGSASNAPIALSIMAVELLGANALPHVVIVAAFAYLFSGHRGIYGAQRLRAAKHGVLPGEARTLRDLRSQARAAPAGSSGPEMPERPRPEP